VEEHTTNIDEPGFPGEQDDVNNDVLNVDEPDIRGGPNVDQPNIDEPDFQGEPNVEEQNDVNNDVLNVDEPDIRGGPNVDQPNIDEPDFQGEPNVEEQNDVNNDVLNIDEPDIQGGPILDKQEPSVDEHTPGIDEPDFQGEPNVEEQDDVNNDVLNVDERNIDEPDLEGEPNVEEQGDVNNNVLNVDEPDIQDSHVDQPHPNAPLSLVAEAVWSRIQADPASTTNLLGFISSKSHKRKDADTISYYRFAIEFNEKWFGVNVQVNVLNIFFSYWRGVVFTSYCRACLPQSSGPTFLNFWVSKRVGTPKCPK
jgi:hypothetical protein